MKQKFVLTLLAFYYTIIFSQNLIPNPGFEADINEKYTSFEQILKGWAKIMVSEPQKRMETFSSFDIPTRKIQSFSIFDILLNSKDIPSIKYTHPEFFVTDPGIASLGNLIKEFYSPAFTYLFESRGVSLFLLKLPQTLLAGKTYSINSAFDPSTNGEPRKNVDHNIFKIYFPSNKDTANVTSFFKSGKHTPETIHAMLKKYSVDELNRIVTIMESNPNLNIKILGYTDDTGDKKYNIKLSKRRASGIANYLVSNGIEKKRIITKGFGESNPVSDNALEYGRLLNRRVEIEFF